MRAMCVTESQSTRNGMLVLKNVRPMEVFFVGVNKRCEALRSKLLDGAYPKLHRLLKRACLTSSRTTTTWSLSDLFKPQYGPATCKYRSHTPPPPWEYLARGHYPQNGGCWIVEVLCLKVISTKSHHGLATIAATLNWWAHSFSS